jgi:sigma-E factor negative regulatory protein RseA
MDTNKKIRERISALSDDELPKDDHELAFAALRTDDGQLAAWEVYHLIGDVLRTGESPSCPTISMRPGARLAAEPLHPRRAGAYARPMSPNRPRRPPRHLFLTRCASGSRRAIVATVRGLAGRQPRQRAHRSAGPRQSWHFRLP